MAKIIDKTEGLLSNPKRAMAWAIVVTVVVVLFFVFMSKITTLFKGIQDKMDSNSIINQEMAATGQKPTYTDAQYRTFANELESAMRGAGTNNQKVYDVFKKMQSYLDVLKLIQAFGTKDDQNLHEWINAEWFLSIGEINRILRGNGIDYSF